MGAPPIGAPSFIIKEEHLTCPTKPKLDPKKS